MVKPNDDTCERCGKRPGLGAPTYCDECVTELAHRERERAARLAPLENHGGGDAPEPVR